MSDKFIFTILLTGVGGSGGLALVFGGGGGGGGGLDPFFFAFVYPVSFLKFRTAVLKNLFAIRPSGDIPSSLQVGHTWSDVSSSESRIPEYRNITILIPTG